MAPRSRNLTAHNLYVVDAAKLSTSTSATRPLSRLKYKVVLHHAEASLQQLSSQSLTFDGFVQFFESFAASVTVGSNSHSLHNPRKWLQCFFFFADGTIFSFIGSR
jgi:hypothetical protein